jgi:prepilin-type N-terminal cleavage/methylation domain-containing protein
MLRHRNDRGFSLVELVIVIGVIGVLVAVGLPTVLGFRERAQDMETKSALTTVARAQAGWVPERNGFTDDEALLEATFPELSFGSVEDSDLRVVVGDLDPGDSGQVLLYARSDGGTWFGIRLVATGSIAGRHTCEGTEADMTFTACSGERW